jgi:hypothetical protein
MEGNNPLPDLIRSDVNPLPVEEEDSIRVYRDTRVKQHCDEQLALYKPCSCGSGKKFKFCCKGKPKEVFSLNTDAG